MTFTTRPAIAEDAKPLGHFLVKAWQQSFAGIVPEAALANEDPDKTAESCAKHIADPSRVVFVAMKANRIAGCVFAVLPQAGSTEGEIKSLFIDQAFQRRGLGKALMAHVATRFLNHGLTALTLGVFKDNQNARAFYQTLGGEPFDERMLDWHGSQLPELQYRFRNLTQLAAQTASHGTTVS